MIFVRRKAVAVHPILSAVHNPHNEVFSSIATATAMLIDVNVSDALLRGRIDEVGEADWYAMNLHEGDISISTHGNCGTEIRYLRTLLDGAILDQENDLQRSILAYNDNNGASVWSKIENHTIPADGKYYVEVQTHGSSQDLSYLLAIDRVGPTFVKPLMTVRVSNSLAKRWATTISVVTYFYW